MITQRPVRSDRWWWRAESPEYTWGFTARRHGVSSGPYGWRSELSSGLNLGGHVGDDSCAVQRNRELVAAEIGLPADSVIYMNQVHGRDVRVLEHVDQLADASWRDQPCDATVTTLCDVALGVLVADCVPVLFMDADAGVCAVAHAGRPGMVAGVVPATLATMAELGCRNVTAAVGPSISGKNYEVPISMRDDVAAVEPLAASITGWGTAAIDVAAGVVAQLARSGVAVQRVGGCTAEELDLYSYRRDGSASGRFAGVVVRRGAFRRS